MDSTNQTKEKGLPIVDHGVDIIGDEWDEGCSDNISGGSDDYNSDPNDNN
tara:strand:- start:574 stop:723 length:150 start_codon:yes stop_codon:yes gene_type:complete